MSGTPSVYLRHAGWRHYIKVQRIRARIRVGKIARALRDGGFDPDSRLGTAHLMRTLALELGVSERTIYRDLHTLRQKPVCPVCGKPRDETG